MIAIEGTGLQSYDISPFRDSSDDDSEDENKRPQKMIPQWARYWFEAIVCDIITSPPRVFTIRLILKLLL